MHKNSALLSSGVAALALAFVTSFYEPAQAQNTHEFIDPVDDPYPYAICYSWVIGPEEKYDPYTGTVTAWKRGFVSLPWPLTEKDPVIGIQSGADREFEQYLKSSPHFVPSESLITTTCISQQNKAIAESKIDDFMAECERTRKNCWYTDWTR